MPVIQLSTFIKAPVTRVFDLARSIDLHQRSMAGTKERVIEGRLAGLIEEGETVTWEAKHLFRTRRLTSKITTMKAPHYFRDEMIEGDFKILQHDHYFNSLKDGTEMKDVFHFKAPFGIIGTIAEQLFLTRYLQKLLTSRNDVIKQEAERL
jgi:ligand-binding SRPBCC domain-containing protein